MKTKIPEGWRELNKGEIIKKGDKFTNNYWEQQWQLYSDSIGEEFPNGVKQSLLLKSGNYIGITPILMPNGQPIPEGFRQLQNLETLQDGDFICDNRGFHEGAKAAIGCTAEHLRYISSCGERECYRKINTGTFMNKFKDRDEVIVNHPHAKGKIGVIDNSYGQLNKGLYHVTVENSYVLVVDEASLEIYNPFKIGGHLVEKTATGLQIGCTFVSNSDVERAYKLTKSE